MSMHGQTGLGHFVKHLAWFFIFEFIILFFVFIITGSFTMNASGPLPVVSAIATSIGTTVWDVGIGFFILGTAVNLVMMFIFIARD